MPTIAQAREVAAQIDSPDDALSVAVTKAEYATRDHLAAAPLAASLRAVGWCDVDVRESVAAVNEGLRALGRAAE